MSEDGSVDVDIKTKTIGVCYFRILKINKNNFCKKEKKFFLND